MSEIELKFERENRDGIAVAQSYLIDAARRLGVEISCERLGLTDDCAVTIKEGGGLLSAPTKAELEVLSDERRKKGERLACQAKLEKNGEVVVLTAEKKKNEEKTEEEKSEEYREKFAALPLEKKIADLVRLEAIALGETFNFILNSPSKIVSKVMDVMAEFGLKMDEEAKDARTPEEHKVKQNGNKAADKKEKSEEEKAKKEEEISKDEPIEAIENEQAEVVGKAETAEAKGEK